MEEETDRDDGFVDDDLSLWVVFLVREGFTFCVYLCRHDGQTREGCERNTKRMVSLVYGAGKSCRI